MNKFTSLLLHLLLFSGIAVGQQKYFTLSGAIQGKTGDYIYLSYPDDAAGTYKQDSSLIGNGQFSFNGTLYGLAVEAVLSLNRIGGINDTTIRFFLVPGTLQLTLDYHNFRQSAVLKGSPVQAQADVLEKSKGFILVQRKLLSDAKSKAYEVHREAVKAKKDEAIVDCLKEAADGVTAAIYALDKQLNKIDLAFMDQYPTSFVTASRLRYLVGKMSLKQAQERYRKLPEEIKNSSVGKFIKVELDKLSRGASGVQAFQFVSTELRGGELKLSGYKGRHVLLDFWASWCVPCRKGNPHLLFLYSKYKDKGLEIIGVSDDDRNPEAWKKAIEKDGIGVWKHVLRGMISDRYGIKTLPTKILIDPQGMIIGRYGGDGENDEALDRKLAELLDK